MIGRPLRRNGLSSLNGLRSAADADFYAPLAVAANLLSEWCSSGADMRNGGWDILSVFPICHFD